jgi:hypothetical protein
MWWTLLMAFSAASRGGNTDARLTDANEKVDEDDFEVPSDAERELLHGVGMGGAKESSVEDTEEDVDEAEAGGGLFKMLGNTQASENVLNMDVAGFAAGFSSSASGDADGESVDAEVDDDDAGETGGAPSTAMGLTTEASICSAMTW